MNQDVEKLFNLLNTSLWLQSPVLSGNMKSGIKLHKIEENEITIIIEAPYYDVGVWERTGAIVLTGETKNGKSAYASDVNKYGGYGRRNKSMHWVNRVCFEIANIVGKELGAQVVNELEL